MRHVHRSTAIVLAILLALVMSSCAGDDEDYEASDGEVARTDSIDALNLVLVTDGEGVARLIGTLVNQADQPDELVDLTLEAEPESGYSVVLGGESIPLAPDEPLRLYRDAQVTVVADDAFRPGFRADVVLTFADSEPLRTTVPIERNTGPYSDVEVTRPPDGDIRPGN